MAIVGRGVGVYAPSELVSGGFFFNDTATTEIYTRVFLATMKRKALAKLERFPGLYDARRVARARTLYEFDDLVTAPLHGFRDVRDYWSRASSAPWLEQIRVTTLLLNALNDPFRPAEALLAASRRAPSAATTSAT